MKTSDFLARIAELKKVDVCDIDSGIHKGHWTYDDVLFAEKKGNKPTRRH